MLLLKSGESRITLRKSQMGLFGTHHIEYTRRNKSGTISRIAAKGTPRPEEKNNHQTSLDFTAPPVIVPPPAAVTPPPEKITPVREVKSVDHKQLIADGEKILSDIEMNVAGSDRVRDKIIEHFAQRTDRKTCDKRARQVARINSKGMLQIDAWQEESLADFYALAGAKSIQSLKYIRTIPDSTVTTRSRKEYDQIFLSQYSRKETVWHEAAHHIEESHKEIGRAAKRFVKDRAQKAGGKPIIKKLKELRPSTNYEDSEMAVLDKFPNPYTGKMYSHDNHSTEVISMGIGAMADRSKFVQIYREDREHLHFILGVLNRINPAQKSS